MPYLVRPSRFYVRRCSQLRFPSAKGLCGWQQRPAAHTKLFRQYLDTRSTLTGDWWGARNDLADKGITFDLTVVQVYQGVLAGGLDKGWQYSGRDDLNINLDTQKMGLWPGGFLNVEGRKQFRAMAISPRVRAAPLYHLMKTAYFPKTKTTNMT